MSQRLRSYCFAILIGLSILPNIVIANDISLSHRAKDKYNNLINNIETIAEEDYVFWQLANALDAMLDYCKATNSDYSLIAKLAYDKFQQKTQDGTQWWRDDYGWWAWLFLRLNRIYPKEEKYLKAAEFCFNQMLEGKNAWQQSLSPLKEEQKPLFENGCYNFALDEDDNFKGIQNTVTNAIFFKSALRFFEDSYQKYRNNTSDEHFAELSKKYFKAMLDQYIWFKHWFDNGLLNTERALNKGALVEERVRQYANGKPAKAYCKNRIWLGDQGLMMSALADLANIIEQLTKYNPLNLDLKSLHENIIALQAKDIANAVKDTMIDNNNNNCLLPYLTDSDDQFPFDDYSDFTTGIGIFMRNLIYTIKHNALLTEIFKKPEYQNIILQNAKLAADTDIIISDVTSFNSEANCLAELNAALFWGMK